MDALSTTELEEICYAQYETNRYEKIAVEHRCEIVTRLLKKLPECERTVVTLHYFAEMTSEEISTFLGISPNTVRSRLRRARGRLEKEESMIPEVLNSFQPNFQPSVNLTEKIMHEISQIKPNSPSISKPWIPWGLSFASTFLVILIMGFGTKALSRFQQSYSLDAISEKTIGLVDIPIVLELERKPDASTKNGRTDTPSKNSGVGFQAKRFLIAQAHAKDTDNTTAKPQWIQTKGPRGVSRTELFLTSDQNLYAIAKRGLYLLTKKEDAWTLVSSSGPNREFSLVMAESGDTLYLLTSNELIASNDKGKTWNSLGARPEGKTIALVITDTAMYLVLQREVFRSEDIGKRWELITEDLPTDNLPDDVNPDFQILDALAIDNTLFVGTSQGLFRVNSDWKKLQVPTSQGINSLTVNGDKLYVGTAVSPQGGPNWSPHAAVFYSTDLGKSWIDITPFNRSKIIVSVEVVAVGETLMLASSRGIILSYDGGKTWTDLGRDRRTLGASPIVALDENRFYKTDYAGILRSTDGGVTWTPFMTGMVNSHVLNLVTVKSKLYALTSEEMFKSVDGGETWKSVGLSSEGNVSLEGMWMKVVAVNGDLYASNSGLDGVTLFRLSDAGNVFLLIEDVPDFEEETLYTERLKKANDAVKSGVNINKVKELLETNQDRVIEEQTTNGIFTFTDDTFFMEYRHKLFRWRRGEMTWHDTGIEDLEGISPVYGKGFTLAASGNTVYVGKREGEIFLSLDGGDTWKDITENLAFPFGYIKEILFTGSTVYVSTDMGVMSSREGETWSVVTDINGNRLIMDWIAVDDRTFYGVCNSGVYQVDVQTNTWKQIVQEVPHAPTSFTVDGDTFYIGTKQSGVLRFKRANR